MTRLPRYFAPLLAVALLLSPALAPQSQAAAISITAASFVPSSGAVFLPGKNIAAVTLTAGQAVYLDTAVAVTAGQVKLADADGTGLATQMVGFAANSAAAGQPVKILVRDPSLTLGGAVTAGCLIMLHTTAGAVTLTPGDLTTGAYMCVIGVGISTTKINFAGTRCTACPNNLTGVIRADVAIP